MKIKANALGCLLMVLLPALAGAGEIHYAVENDHTNLLYHVSESAVYSVKVTRDGHALTKGMVSVVLDNFGPNVVLQTNVNLAAGNPFVVKGTLSEPGFLRLRAKTPNEREFVWSVGYEPEKISKGSSLPDDFDDFWSVARAKLAKTVPLDPQVAKVPERCTPAFNFYRASFATYGRRVYGYMSVPTDKTKAPYPVEISVSAAGFGDYSNDMKGDAEKIKVFFSVYPWAPHWQWKMLGLNKAYDFMNEAYAGKYKCKRYCTAGIGESRESYFYYPVILGLDRAIDWVAARPYADRSRFYYQGTSQGGGLGICLTALNHTFTKAVFYVPAITDVMGYRRNRQSGWPQLIESQGTDEARARAECFAPYFDAANFASRIKCPVRVAVGFSDMTCAPCAVYAAYNEIKVSDKAIEHGYGMSHSCFPSIYKTLGDWLEN